MKTGSVLFTEKHLQSFRDYSQDENPLHIDEEYASRTPFSERGLYGVVSVFFLLSKSELKRVDFTSLKIDFKKLITLKKIYKFSIERDRSKHILKIFRGKSIYTIVKIDTVNGERQKSLHFSLNSFGDHSLIDKNPNWNTLPDDIKKQKLFKIYPGLESIHYWLLKILAWSSYWVGMVAPGQQAIYTQFKLDIKDNNLKFSYDRNEVHDLLKRYRSFFKSPTGSLITMISFLRPEPVDHLQDFIFKNKNDSTLKNQVCFITGGTRGVGSVFSQMFASKSASCFGSYFKNEITSKKTEKFIQSKGKSFKALKSDNFIELFEELQGKKLNCLVLNAAPSIRKIDPSELSKSDFKNEFDYFYNLTMRDVLRFKDYLAADATIINISTTYITDKPHGFAHYYDAKKAIENNLKKFSKNYPQLTILNFRLPKMHTDQTNDNIVNDIVLSPIKVVDIVIKYYLSRSSLTGFHNFKYDLEKIYEIDI
jgi:hypothetical protein